MHLQKNKCTLQSFHLTKFLALSLILLLAGCLTTPPAAPTATLLPPTQTQAKATFTAPLPSVTALAPTSTPVPPTATFTPTPSPEPIEPKNAVDLGVVNNLSQTQARNFTWLAQSESLALGTQQGVRIYTLPGLRPASDIAFGQPNFLTNSPDQRELAWATQDNVIQLWKVSATNQPLDLSGNTGPVTGLAFSPDGQRLASASYDMHIFIWNNGQETPAQTWEIPFWASNLSFSPDGTEMAGVNLQEFEIQIWKTANGDPVRNLSWTEHASPALYGAFFSPDWTSVAWTARGTVQLMSVVSGDLGPTLNHEDFVNGVAWSPDGSLLAVATAATIDGNFQPVVVIWNAASGEKVTTLPQSDPTLNLQFSPDGKKLATLTSNGALQIWAVSK